MRMVNGDQILQANSLWSILEILGVELKFLVIQYQCLSLSLDM